MAGRVHFKGREAPTPANAANFKKSRRFDIGIDLLRIALICYVLSLAIIPGIAREKVHRMCALIFSFL